MKQLDYCKTKRKKTSYNRKFIFIIVISSLSLCLHDSIIQEKEQILYRASTCFSYGSVRHNAMNWLIYNMRYRNSYKDSIGFLYRSLLYNNPQVSPERLWIILNSRCPESPKLISDIDNIDPNIIIENVNEAVSVWEQMPWRHNISFGDFCNYILPYNIDQEPIIRWRAYYRKKYSHILNGIRDIKDAFSAIINYEKENFIVSNSIYAYEQDPIMLDMLHRGDCRQRAFHTIYIMRALGLPVALDYSPVWGNYGKNAHFWPVLIYKGSKAFTGIKSGAGYIDGSYEKSEFTYSKEKFTSSIDSLKKISKVYRKTFQYCNKNLDQQNKRYYYLQDPFSSEVTQMYNHTTIYNKVTINAPLSDILYVCTFSQSEGWIPVGLANRIDRDTVDIGPLIHENLIVVGRLIDNEIEPVSLPHYIRYKYPPLKIQPDINKKEVVRLHRKYMLGTIWINRWGEIKGATIEASDSKMFEKNPNILYKFKDIPNSETMIITLKDIKHNYIRIKPAQDFYPTFAELHLIEENGSIIPNNKYHIYAIGNSLTGDTVVTKKLQDFNIATTFYKRFPFWIGFDIKSIRDKIGGIQIIMRNDGNQIIPGHRYELFYYNGKWISLGRKKATHTYVEFSDVPC